MNQGREIVLLQPRLAADQHGAPSGVSSSLANLLAQALGIATATHHTPARPPQQVRGQRQQVIG